MILTSYNIVELLLFIYFPTNSLTIDNDITEITEVCLFKATGCAEVRVFNMVLNQ